MLKFGARWRGLLSKQSMHSCTNTNTAPEYTGTFSSSAEYLSSWLATTEKKGEQCLTGRGERRRAPSQSSSHGNQAGERAFEMRKQKDDKVQPLSSIFLLLSAPSPPPILLRFVQRKEKKKRKNKMEKDIKDISDDRWGGTTKEKTSRDGSHSAQLNKMQKKKRYC